MLVIVAAALAAPTPKADEDDPMRLPRNSVPSHYDITLTSNVHVGTRRFDGNVRIDIEIIQQTNVLTLHTLLTIKNGLTKIIDSDDVDLFESREFDTSKDFVHFTTTRMLEVGEKLTLEVPFRGVLTSNMAGFYLSSYTVNGTTR